MVYMTNISQKSLTIKNIWVNITGVGDDDVTENETESEHRGIISEAHEYASPHGMSIIAEMSSAQMYTDDDVSEQPTSNSYNL